jgi:uncharacterized protein YqgV (UPF0045/DUF77 family)
LAIYRNFSGQVGGYEEFKRDYFNRLNRRAPERVWNVLEEILESFRVGGRRFPLVIAEDSMSQTAFCHMARNTFSRTETINGSPFTDDTANSEYIMGCVTEVIRLADSDKKLLAISLNKTAEGALFDLFNKFFMKMGGVDVFRVAKEGGSLSTAVFNPKFNLVVLIDKSDLHRESPAFLNRFEKYEFNFSDMMGTEVEVLYNRVLKKLKRIEEIFRDEKLSHYTLSNLFFNYSENTLKSLVWRVATQGRRDRLTPKQMEEMCIRMLSKVASKDFEHLFKLVIQANEVYNQEEFVRVVSEGLAQKEKEMKEGQLAVLIVTDQNLQGSQNNDDKVIVLAESKNEQDLAKQITEYMSNPTCKDGTLFIDFSREVEERPKQKAHQKEKKGQMVHEDNIGNLNDPMQYFDQDKNLVRIEVGYVLNLIQKCKGSLEVKKKAIYGNKIKIVLNYNRLRK